MEGVSDVETAGQLEEPSTNMTEAEEDSEEDADQANGQLHETATSPEREPLPADLITSADYSLFDNPPNLGNVRQRLFELNATLELSPSDWKTFWPFMDNIWVRNRSIKNAQQHTETEYFWCRLRRPVSKPKEVATAEGPSQDTPAPVKKRRKVAREGKTCAMGIKVITYTGAVSTVTILRMVEAGVDHSHDLDHIDSTKRNSAVMETARREAVKGFLPASVFAKLNEERQKLIEAGGKFMKVADIRNISRHWREEHSWYTLKPHPGYEHQKGGGIVKVADNAPFPFDDSSIFTPPPSTPEHIPLPPGALRVTPDSMHFLEPYLPVRDEARGLPHVTLTYASSLDSKISLAPGVQTILSGPESKAMTHYLRSKHDAILIGSRTAVADDPGLNCRLEGAGGYGGIGWTWQPRPIVVDPYARWHIHPESRILKTAAEGKGRAPWIVVSPQAYLHPVAVTMLRDYGGSHMKIWDHTSAGRLAWPAILRALAAEGIRSVMIEGGGYILSELLNAEWIDMIDSVIITIAPTYLGKAGVGVSPNSKHEGTGKPIPASRLREVKWQPMGAEDVVLCGKLRTPPLLPGIEAIAQQDGG